MGLNHQGSGHFSAGIITRARQLIMISLPRFAPIKQEKLMSAPTIADNKPVKLALDKDKKYYFCMCGLSSKQPFCYGSHKGSDFTPMAFQCDENKDYTCASASTAATNPTVMVAISSSATTRSAEARVNRPDYLQSRGLPPSRASSP